MPCLPPYLLERNPLAGNDQKPEEIYKELSRGKYRIKKQVVGGRIDGSPKSL